MSFILDWVYDTLAWFGAGLYYLETKVVFLGLDNAGKTTLIQLLRTGDMQAFEPTTMPGKEEITLGSLKIEAHDLGGHAGARTVWKDFLVSVGGVIFLVDSYDRERFPEAKKELDELLRDEKLANTPLLILGNKIDIPGAVGEHELRVSLGLMETTGKETVPESGVRPMEVFMCSLQRRTGYADGFNWLEKQIRARME